MQIAGRPVIIADAEKPGGYTQTYNQVWSCEHGCGFTSEDFNDVVLHERSAHKWVGRLGPSCLCRTVTQGVWERSLVIDPGFIWAGPSGRQGSGSSGDCTGLIC